MSGLRAGLDGWGRAPAVGGVLFAAVPHEGLAGEGVTGGRHGDAIAERLACPVCRGWIRCSAEVVKSGFRPPRAPALRLLSSVMDASFWS